MKRIETKRGRIKEEETEKKNEVGRRKEGTNGDVQGEEGKRRGKNQRMGSAERDIDEEDRKK